MHELRLGVNANPSCRGCRLAQTRTLRFGKLQDVQVDPWTLEGAPGVPKEAPGGPQKPQEASTAPEAQATSGVPTSKMYGGAGGCLGARERPGELRDGGTKSKAQTLFRPSD